MHTLADRRAHCDRLVRRKRSDAEDFDVVDDWGALAEIL